MVPPSPTFAPLSPKRIPASPFALVAPAPKAVCESPDPAVLGTVAGRDVNLALWRRSTSPQALPAAALDYAAKLTAHPFERRLDHAGLLVGPPLPTGPGRDELITDWQRSLATFRQLAGEAHVDAKVMVVTTDKCRFFHADYNHLRWLCTYAGPGTEWLADADVDRPAAPLGQIPPCEINRRLVPDRSRVRRASVGDVVILKGHDYPHNAGTGAIHRSPPVAATGERRLLLTMTWH